MFGKNKKDSKKEKKRSEVKNNKEESPTSHLQKETMNAIIAVVFFVLAVFLVLSSGLIDKGGKAGTSAYKIFHYLFGVGYYLLPILFFILCVSFFRSLQKKLALTHSIGGTLFFLSSLALINILSQSGDGVGSGGVIGGFISKPLINMFDTWVSIIILLALIIISLLTIFDAPIRFTFIKSLFVKKEVLPGTEDDGPEVIITSNGEPLTDKDKKEMGKEDGSFGPKKAQAMEDKKDEFGISPLLLNGKEFIPPPLSLLNEDHGKPGVGDIKANSNIIKRTLANFGINVEMDEISIGPSITRYALKPAEGIKLSRIVGLQNDLSLALAAHPIRIEAPIPGKSLVGIEIPNSTKTTVGLGTLLSSNEFQNSDKPLLISLGKGISGMSYFGNLAKAPHLLIAGATGSGKSVTIHTVITSLLYRNSPDNLKFIMIDPKRVELTLYNKIPHLLTPVITEAKKTILALKWAAKEMDRRYDILQAESLQNISSYHKNIVEPELKRRKNKRVGDEEKQVETMPYIVIVIDELADIMQAYPRELESAIVRLAQMSRAVGIHLILSTQRPSVNVITGLIKANIPSRIALQVASQIDSRTILDMGGAEKLLGAGDMLYLSGEMSQPQRIQSAYISESETKSVVKYLVDSYVNEIPTEINITGDNQKNNIFEATIEDEKMENDDDLYEEARQTVLEAGKASTSYLQRKLGVGYARAARLIDMLEERGVIGPGSGAKPREILDGGNDNEMPPENTSE
ncbi:MAG TPA: cell division protein FtsK [Candidatus Zambryskibacteria bacterium]|nr:cell division protein FtsK [Candidatus Zambryskibacteria bacterium]HBO17275.1 cell division protein FtsK [Candidatus Zambryskibacteria bacterium]HBZ04110.1 cell division protein FtsK [Candidatus Zambryskibacteria bacterium]